MLETIAHINALTEEYGITEVSCNPSSFYVVFQSDIDSRV